MPAKNKFSSSSSSSSPSPSCCFLSLDGQMDNERNFLFFLFG